jgi:small acid-soluble spore protein E (minor gamma-type SASP)
MVRKRCGYFSPLREKVMVVEVRIMNKQPNKTVAGTNIQHVKQQNAQTAGQFGTEFASETDVQQVKQSNAQAEAKKAQNSSK